MSGRRREPGPAVRGRPSGSRSGSVAVAGLAVSGYLTAVRASGDDPACVVGGGCQTVQESEYSELAGIPVAVLGLVAYAALLVAALLPGPLGRAPRAVHRGGRGRASRPG